MKWIKWFIIRLGGNWERRSCSRQPSSYLLDREWKDNYRSTTQLDSLSKIQQWRDRNSLYLNFLSIIWFNGKFGLLKKFIIIKSFSIMKINWFHKGVEIYLGQILHVLPFLISLEVKDPFLFEVKNRIYSSSITSVQLSPVRCKEPDWNCNCCKYA